MKFAVESVSAKIGSIKILVAYRTQQKPSRTFYGLSKLALVLVHLDDVASVILNANHGILRPPEKLG